jgi:hypothetical protein
MRDVDRERIDQLWTLQLEDFTRGRDELAREAKAEGDPEAAREIKALRKPSVSAWAVNQLARSNRPQVEQLIELGEALRKAQQAAMSGEGREALRKVTIERRRLVDQLVAGAASILEEAGHGSSRATLDRVADTLMATAADEAAAESVREGVLQRDVPPPSGFDELAEMLPAGSARTARKEASKVSSLEDRRQRQARERAEELASEAAEAQREAKQARQEADRLAREAQRAARMAEEQEERAAKARERADRARQH